MLIRVAVGILGFSALFGIVSTSHASHSFSQAGGINYLYRNLEAPTGNGIIFYTLCGDAQNPVPPSEWGLGIENWDTAIGRWQFSPVACGGGSYQTRLTWENAIDGFCQDPPPPLRTSACWIFPQFTQHGSHRDVNLNKGLILFDHDIYSQNFFSSSWRVAIAAHEWGHNLGLADHDNENPCPPPSGIGSIMGKALPNPLGDACIQGPTTNDLASVDCNVYHLCAGVRVAAGNVYGGSCDEIITAPGPGLDPWVRVWIPLLGCDWSSGRVVVAQFLAYAEGFEGGVYLAAGNIDPSTGLDEIITGAGAGGGPHVRVWRVSGSSAVPIQGFFAYESNFPGGVHVGAGDLNCDGVDEMLTAPGPGRITQVRTWKLNLSLVGQFDAYNWNGGGFVAGGNISTGYCGDEILTGADWGGGPHARAWCCASGGEIAGWYAYSQSFWGGVRVAVGNNDASTPAHEMLTAPGPAAGYGPLVIV